MHEINFSINHNGKLFAETFSDLRALDDEKYFIGNELTAILKNKVLGIVKVVAIRSTEYIQIRDVLAFINCGFPAAYQAALLSRFYNKNVPLPPRFKLQHIVFQYVSRNMEVQNVLITEWWNDIKLKEQELQNTKMFMK
jgi:hypothetical protein